ncbi:MAG: response regulator [Chloroflexi bacterium]|nr:response regulator [Chloroflexota bacterium]
MADKTLEEYKKKVDQFGQTLLDAIASVATGDLDVEFEIPEDIEVFADLAVGLQFMIEDIQEMTAEQKETRYELEQRVVQRTRELETTLQDLQTTQRKIAVRDWEEYSDKEKVKTKESNLPARADQAIDWLPSMAKAVQVAETTHIVNGNNEENLALPIRLHGEVIGVLGFHRSEKEQSWGENDISTVEAVVEQVGLALENQRLFDQTQEAFSETDVLYKASAELNVAQGYDEILTILRNYTMLGKSSTFVTANLFIEPWIGDNLPAEMTSISRWSTREFPGMDNPTIDLTSWSNIQDLLKSEELTIIQDLAKDPRMDNESRGLYMGKLDANMVVFAPLVSARQWIGVIVATYQEKSNFPEFELQRLMSLSGQAAVAIQNIRLLAETTRKANQLETAAEISREAASTLDVENLLNRAVNLIRDRFGFYHASIFFKEGNNAVVRASTGTAGKELVRTRHSLPLKEGGSVIGHVTQTGEPLVANDVSRDATHRPHPLLPETVAELGIPMKIGDRVIGALDVQSTVVNAFSPDDISVLQTLADQITIAVDNARSFELSEQAVEEMRELDRFKSQFLANMSHELRTPLNSIIGFSRVILKGIDGPINDLQTQDLTAIYSSGQHLLEMINSILDLSKIEAGKMELSIEEIQLNELIQSTISTAIGLVKEKPIKLVNNIPDELPTVNADRTRVRQILLNLLQNASKFTDEGTITIDSYQETSPQGIQEFIISVTDTGIGISEEDQIKLFEPFSQVDDSPTRKTGGTGLGLSISRRLVEMQGGRIWLESEVGIGTTFYFSLPLVSEALPIVIEEDQPIEGDKVIMSIDDDQDVIGLYNRYLQPHGFQVIAITDPTLAMQEIRKIKPLAITLDIMMPKQDGWQLIEQIKSDPETKDIPVVICSITENQEKGFSLGATDYLVKPILEEELVQAIKRLNIEEEKEEVNILLVDDDPDTMRLIEIMLSKEKSYKLQFAQGGLEGLAAIQSNTPDAVILDLFMPDLDGFSLLETIRTDPAVKDLPVIVLTAGDLTDEEIKELANHKQQYLRKDNLNEEELMRWIRRLRDERKQRI